MKEEARAGKDNRNLALEIAALFLALLSLIFLVMGAFCLIVSIVKIPGVDLPPGVSAGVAFLYFAPVLLLFIGCIALRASVR